LNADGHILLVDLGGVLDQDGKVLGKNTGAGNFISPLLAQRFESKSSPLQLPDESEVLTQSQKARKNRRMSIMGTFGYMAPEMVIMLGQTSAEKVGYTNAVDWWSLGVTIFRLLTGFR
jgi:serine/threonine protein kinase